GVAFGSLSLDVSRTSGFYPDIFMGYRRGARRHGSAGWCRGGDEAELLEHLEPVELQVERDVLAVAGVEHLDVVHGNRGAGGRDVSGRTVEDAVVRSRERALLDSHVVNDVNAVDLDMRVGERAEPAAEERGAGRPPLAGDAARRAEHDV